MMESKSTEIEDVNLILLRLIEANPQLSQREIADAMGVSLGKVNYCLKALMAQGWLKMQNFQGSKNKLAYAYLLTPSGVIEKAAITTRFLNRKMQEYEQLKILIETLQNEVNFVKK
jgi:EPS-associated MarR family transcriptional regulator